MTTCGAETRIAVKLILNIYLMLNLLGFHHGNLGQLQRSWVLFYLFLIFNVFSIHLTLRISIESK